MAEITPLRFKKDVSWEENELSNYYTDPDRRAQLLDFLGSKNGNGEYIFDRERWEIQQKKYKELKAELDAQYDELIKERDKWEEDQKKKGKDPIEYRNSDEYDKYRKAGEIYEKLKEKGFSKNKQEILEKNTPELTLRLLNVYGEIAKDFATHPELKGKFADLEGIIDNMFDSDWKSEDGKNKIDLQNKKRKKKKKIS